MSFEDFHIVALEETSNRIAALLMEAGVRIQRRVIVERSREEHLIAVHVEDIELAHEVFRKDLGPCQTFTSNDS